MEDKVIVENFIGGKFLPSEINNVIPSYNPATGEVWALLPDSADQEADLAVQAAVGAFPAWSKLGYEERATYLMKIAEKVCVCLAESCGDFQHSAWCWGHQHLIQTSSRCGWAHFSMESSPVSSQLQDSPGHHVRQYRSLQAQRDDQRHSLEAGRCEKRWVCLLGLSIWCLVMELLVVRGL